MNKQNKIKFFKSNTVGITLISLVITIIVLLILAGVTIISLTGDNGILNQSITAKNKTSIEQEKEQIKLAYMSLQTNNLSESVNKFNLQDEITKIVGDSKAKVTISGDGSYNILFTDTSHNFNLTDGIVTEVEADNSMAIFDVGSTVASKMHLLAANGEVVLGGSYIMNLSIDAIKKSPVSPDLSTMTDSNIVSWTEAYSLYEQNPDAYVSMIPKGTKLCPIYMWFEENENTEIRDVFGNLNLTTISRPNFEKEVKSGTIYWWTESNNVYLNIDASYMFANLPYLTDISGLRGLRTDYCTDMSMILLASLGNQKLSDIKCLANWDTSNVTNMRYALAGNKALNNIDSLKYWNTSNVTNMYGMFGGDLDIGTGSGITYLSALANWDVGKVTDMSFMFF